MKVHFKGSFTILRNIGGSGIFQFLVPFQEKNNIDIKIEIERKDNKKHIDTTCQYEISDSLWEALQNGEDNEISEEDKEELSNITNSLREATKEVLNHIKYYLGEYELEEPLFSGRGYFWSLDKKEWKQLHGKISVQISMPRKLYLGNNNNSEKIQQLLEQNETPYFKFSLNFLHKAKRENHPHFKWINATIAAELAIKEFLSRKEPKVRSILIELPSPPFSKLFGSILEKYAGEKSPKRNKLINGQNIRNQLVHRPQEVPITIEKAEEYVRDVEIAIYHLLHLLYPNNNIITMFCRRVLDMKPCNNCNKLTDFKEMKCVYCRKSLI